MPVPDRVRTAASAAFADVALPPTVRAASFEIASGRPTRLTVIAATHFFSRGGASEDHVIAEALGGQQGEFWAATAALKLTSEERTKDVEDWLTWCTAAAPKSVWAASSGAAAPSILRDATEAASRLDDSFVKSLEALIVEALEKLLRQAGVQIMASVKDKKIKMVLENLDLESLAVQAGTIQASPTKSVLAVSRVDLASLLEKAAAQLRKRLEAAFGRNTDDVVELWEGLVGETVAIQDTSRNAVAFLVEAFNARAARLLMIDEPGPTDEQVELGESVRGPSIGRGLITEAIGYLTSATGLDMQGLVDGLPPSSAARSSVLDQVEARLKSRGEEVAAIRTETEQKIEQVEILLAAAVAGIAAAQALSNSGDESVKRTQKRILEQKRKDRVDLRAEIRALREDQAARLGEAGGFDRRRRIDNLAEALASGRAVMTKRSVWRHGSPANPFKPHQALDGVSSTDESWASLRLAPLEYGTKEEGPKSRGPFSGGAWYPGDHAGCTCRMETVVELELKSDPDVLVAV